MVPGILGQGDNPTQAASPRENSLYDAVTCITIFESVYDGKISHPKRVHLNMKNLAIATQKFSSGT